METVLAPTQIDQIMETAQYVHGGLAEALNAKVYGNGTQTLVMAHGFGLDQTVWHYLLPCLVCYFKVVVFDLAFAGTVRPELYDHKKYSTFDGYAQDLLQLLEEMNVHHSIYIGHSMSAMIGCFAASQKPHLFHHLILLGSSPRYLNEGTYVGGFERSNITALLHEMKDNFSTWVPNFVPKAIGVNDTKSIQEFQGSLGRMRPEVALDVAETVFFSDVRGVLEQVMVPCTIIQSEEDIFVPKSVAYYIKKKLGGNGRVEILKTRGHVPQLTAYSLLLNVLKGVFGVEGC